MTTREKMIETRKQMGLSIPDMARKCEIGSYLLQMIEDGAVTTPKLVPKIAEQYGLTDLESEELIPEHMRPHGDDYEPDRYVIHESKKVGLTCSMSFYDDPLKDVKWGRNEAIIADRDAGMTWSSIGKKYGISTRRAQRVYEGQLRRREKLKFRRDAQ